MFTGRMSCRRLSILLERLPVESEFKTELRDTVDLSALPPPAAGSYGAWSQLELLVARLGDLMSHWLWMNADPEHRSKTPPAPYPRPGVEASNVKPISPQAQAYMDYMRKHRRHPPDDWTPEVG